MDRDIACLLIIAVAAFCFGLINGIGFLLKRNRTAQTVGTITSIRMPNQQNFGSRNSKWATVSYKVNGKTCQSENRIQVSMAAQIGTPVTVRYDTQKPERLYQFSVLRMAVSFFLSAVCIAAAAFRLV